VLAHGAGALPGGDRPSRPTPARSGLEGGKMLLRINDTDPGTVETIEGCARAVSALADSGLVAMVEPLPYGRAGSLVLRRDAASSVRAVAQRSELLDGTRVPLFAGVFAIFGHGNVLGMDAALYDVRDQLPTWRGQTEEGMPLAAVAYAKATERRQVVPPSGRGSAARGAGGAGPHLMWRHRVRRAAQGHAGARQGEGGLRAGGATAARGGCRVPGAPARALHGPTRRRAHRVGRDRPRAVARPGVGQQQAGPLPAAGARGQACLPSSRGPPTWTRSSTSSGSSPTWIRARQPLPGHGPRRLLRGEQPQDHPALPRADHLCAPQAGGAEGPRAGPAGEPLARRGRPGRRHVRPPVRRTDMPDLLDALAELDRDTYCVIEQDLYRVEPHIPLPVQARAARYYRACGLGPMRRPRTDPRADPRCPSRSDCSPPSPCPRGQCRGEDCVAPAAARPSPFHQRRIEDP
jgi:hypothetical protein